MAERDLEVDVYDFLQRIQLEQFFEKIDKVLHLTRLAHFDHVAESDLSDINMSKPEQRRLFDAIKKHKKERKKASKTRFSLRKKKKDSLSVVPSNGNAAKHNQGKSCLINESSVKLLGELGDGAFGVVHKGEWIPSKGSKITVAVKGLKFSDKEAFIKEQDNFMREASAMSDLDHSNVIRLYGIVLATPIKLVMELAPLGSLHDRLKAEPQKFLVSTLYDFVLQVASGMSYLESKRYVHRDLAARNILLASYDKVKIGDFGLMRLLPTEDGIYIMNPTGKVAVAWCAPECLKNREFSHASDVWAFGVTVIEIFSYGKQPWSGLSGVQILDIIDEPANGRPGKPDHCPEKLYSLLIEHCWDPSPKDRSKFSSIKDKLQEAVPEDVTMFFDVEKGENPDNLAAKSGDLVTVITWKSRLGTEFAKGQNKRTAEVGYFPVSKVTRNISKNRGSGARFRIPKVKDISPPLDNSFSHCAHRGHGETPNWGTIMSEERQVLGKYHPLNLPTKLITLNNSDGETQIVSEALWDTGEMDTCSLISRDGVNYSSSLSLGQRSWADSGYYSNRDTFMSQDYEPMIGSNPIAIPGISPPGRQIVSPGINHPGTYNPTHYSRRPSGASLQVDPYHVQRSVEDSFFPDGATIVPNASGLRPALPVKQGLIGNHGNMRRVSSASFYTNGGIGKPGNENPYENFSEVTGTKYEDMKRLSHVTPQVSEEPQISSSSESVSKNQCDVKSEKSFNFLNINYPIIYDRPAVDNLFDCQRTGRCYSFPEVDMKTKFADRGVKRNSFSSCDKKILVHPLNESKSAPILDREVAVAPNAKNWEIRTPDEALNEEIYENIEIYNVPQAIMSEIPPPLPVKRRSSERRVSVQRNSGSHDLDISQKLASTEQEFEEHYLSPVSRNAPSNFDAHLYAEISDKLMDELSFENQDGVNIEDKNLEKLKGQCKGSFTEISKDYADLDAICAKLRENPSEDVESAENDEAADKLTPCVFECKNQTSNKNDVLWRRLSTDQQRIEQLTRRPLGKRPSISGDDHVPSNSLDTLQSSSASNQSVSSNSLKHACSELESVQSLHTCASLVTTV